MKLWQLEPFFQSFNRASCILFAKYGNVTFWIDEKGWTLHFCVTLLDRNRSPRKSRSNSFYLGTWIQIRMEKGAASLLHEKWVFFVCMQIIKIIFTACLAYSTSSMEVSSPNYRRGRISSVDLSSRWGPSTHPAPEACLALPSGAQRLNMNTASGATCCLFILLVGHLFVYVIKHARFPDLFQNLLTAAPDMH